MKRASTLRDLGISGSALAPVPSYLTDHTCRVTWKGSASDPSSLTTGVPQGCPGSNPSDCTAGHWVLSFNHMTVPTTAMHMTQPTLSFSQSEAQVEA